MFWVWIYVEAYSYTFALPSNAAYSMDLVSPAKSKTTITSDFIYYLKTEIFLGYLI